MLRPPSTDVNVNVLANAIEAIADFCTPSENGHNCSLDAAAGPTFILVNGENVTASVRYRRVGSTRWYQEFAH